MNYNRYVIKFYCSAGNMSDVMYAVGRIPKFLTDPSKN